MDDWGEEKISFELNGTSWVWGALDQESEWNCSIDGCNKAGGLDDAHIEFELQTVMSDALYGRCQRLIGSATLSEPPSDSEGERRVAVSHRFNDFKTLSEILVAAYPYLCIPPLPPNQLSRLSNTYACRCTKLKEIPSLLGKDPDDFRAQSWNEIFSKAAGVFNARASSWNSNTEHFEAISSVLEGFSKTVKRLRKLASVSAKNKEKARSRETALKALSVEAEFHWVLKNQTERLAIELADFCESHAELLVTDANLCDEATDALITKPRHDM
ncbi:unnamed protein product [Taenia asiatica]|uniref:PX domain-containing protein n=1 Tax=Taenia asiatica TaxID=60517 RepID=A0A0R3W794_TAEAS|nr:unnamed protein product [Taenia asiatica]